MAQFDQGVAMTRSIVRFACMGLMVAVLALPLGAAHAFCIWGFGRCESSNVIAGEYTRDGNPSNVLSITQDTITAKAGPVSFSVPYTIKTVEGKNVTIELSRAEAKETVQLQVEKDLVKVRNHQHFAGDWKKRGN
jgi:hypothetical protein